MQVFYKQTPKKSLLLIRYLKGSGVIPCFFRKYMRHILLRLPTSFYLKQHHSKYILTKGQLISERNFGVFKSPKNPTKFLTDFCPSFKGYLFKIWLPFGEI